MMQLKSLPEIYLGYARWSESGLFASGGSETVESCLKLARQFAISRGGSSRYKVISLTPLIMVVLLAYSELQNISLNDPFESMYLEMQDCCTDGVSGSEFTEYGSAWRVLCGSARKRDCQAKSKDSLGLLGRACRRSFIRRFSGPRDLLSESQGDL